MAGVLHPEVLREVRVGVTGVPAAVAERLAALGASVAEPPDVLVVGASDLEGSLDAAWAAVRDGVNAGWADEQARAGGKVILVGPAGPVGAALENLARTLSIEWSRYGVRVSAVVGGTDEDAAEIVAFLASPAGEYYSGATFSLTS